MIILLIILRLLILESTNPPPPELHVTKTQQEELLALSLLLRSSVLTFRNRSFQPNRTCHDSVSSVHNFIGHIIKTQEGVPKY